LPRPLSRRTVLRGATAFAATAAFAAYAKRARLSGAHFDTTQVRLALPSIGPSHHGVSVAQLSDLHLGDHSTPDERVLQALAAVASADVDLLVLTGDFLTWSKKPLERFESLLRDRGSQPTIAVLGNHDHRVDEAGVRRTLERLGIAVLQNQHTAVRLRGKDFVVVGIDDGVTRHDDAAAALKGSERAESRLVLTHSPPTVRRLPADAGLLCLSGHTHGGALGQSPLARGAFTLLGQPYLRGAHLVGGNHVYVNRGLGMGDSLVHPRIDATPELTLFSLGSQEVSAAGSAR
jgi:uncharacterized protein